MFYGDNVKGKTTMGIITSIRDAEVKYGKVLTHDISANAPDTKLAKFLDVLREATTCGAGTKEFWIIGNKRAIEGLMQLQQARNRLIGCIPQCSQTELKTLKPYTIERFGGKFNMFGDSYLERIYKNSSFMILMPADMMAIHTIPNNYVDTNFNIVRTNTSNTFEVTPTDPNNNQFRCDKGVHIKGTLAFQYVGLSTGMYRIITGA